MYDLSDGIWRDGLEYVKKEGRIEGIAQGFLIFLAKGVEFEKIAGLYNI